MPSNTAGFPWNKATKFTVRLNKLKFTFHETKHHIRLKLCILLSDTQNVSKISIKMVV